MILGGTKANIASLRFDFYALYDSQLICENQTAYVNKGINFNDNKYLEISKYLICVSIK